VLRREGATLATYGLNSGPLGYRPLRDFLVAKLKRDAGIICSAEEILITSGSLQAIDLVNGILLAHGDSVLIEEATYGVLSRFAARTSTRSGSRSTRGLPRHARGRARRPRAPRHRPKYIYDSTVQNPTSTIMGEPRARCWDSPTATACRSSRTIATRI
jgi:2-aminoadipate transaminase